jgi:hypothetical protein
MNGHARRRAGPVQFPTVLQKRAGPARGAAASDVRLFLKGMPGNGLLRRALSEVSLLVQ